MSTFNRRKSIIWEILFIVSNGYNRREIRVPLNIATPILYINLLIVLSVSFCVQRRNKSYTGKVKQALAKDYVIAKPAPW